MLAVTSDARVLEEFFEDSAGDARAVVCWQPFADVEFRDAGRERWLGYTAVASIGDGPLEQAVDAARAQIVQDDQDLRGHMLGELRRSDFVVDEEAFRALPFELGTDDGVVERLLRHVGDDRGRRS